MTYLPFARKWRPQDFDEIVGQEHITTTLKNAISMNRLHHAYLFTGPRGIGKTSTARIFSKALNCEKGISVKPCNACTSCREITSGVSMDVIEIDGASNRGIDEIRTLRESVKFASTKGLYKIYIIDEVHMLTLEAFNALLKTLEEPPPHVKFIFATTEPHKVLPTILSRCQRFDFRRIQVKDIITKLYEVAKEEKLDIEQDALLYIARASDGSMRDAESILDRIASFSKTKICVKDIIEALGMMEQETLFRAADIIINKDTKSGIHLIGEILNSGKDAKQFLVELLEHFRNMMIVKIGIVSDEIINMPKDAIERMDKVSKLLSQGDIFYIIGIISNALRMLKQLVPERITLELCMIKLTARDSICSLEEIISKLPDLNKEINKPPSDSSGHSAAADNRTFRHTPEPREEQVNLKKITQPPLSRKHDEDIVLNDTKSSVDINRVKDAWPILVKAMAVKKMSVSSYLAEGEVDSIKGNSIMVGFPRELNFHREVLEEKNNKAAVESALSQILDKDVKISFIATDRKVKELEGHGPQAVGEDLKKKEPAISAALGLFGGKIFKGAPNT